MKTIELPDEFLAQITRDDLLENYEIIVEDIIKCHESMGQVPETYSFLVISNYV